MKRLAEKTWIFVVAICLVGLLSSFVSAAVVQSTFEETSSEQVEVEECEAINEGRQRREKKSRFERPSRITNAIRQSSCVRIHLAQAAFITERQSLNGLGTYLRI